MSMTIDDIVREMRKDMPRVIDPKVILRNYADRIEKAVTNCNQLKMRETVAETEKSIDKAISILEQIPETCGFAGILEDACDVLCYLKEEFVKPALAEPPRNCDLFGGDPKKLHELWWEWSGDLKNCNADGTVKFTFGEWLLMPAEAKGGAQ